MGLSPRAREIVEEIERRVLADPEAFIAQATGGDPELRSEIEAWLEGATQDKTLAGVSEESGEAGLELPAGTRIGGFTVEGVLGAGGFGVVYRARGAGGRSVALKTVQAPRVELLHSIRCEIHTLSCLSHPGVVPIRAHGIHEGLPWYAMDLLDGPLLTSLVAEPGGSSEIAPQRLRLALRMVQKLCATLSYLHGEGLVHRDLKPDNVILREERDPILLDFGLTGRVFGSQSREELEISGLTVGTVHYMSPEQSMGGLIDARSDIYSLGCILYELLCGRPPFSGRSMRVLEKHQTLTPAPPSSRIGGIPPELDALVLRLLAKDPAERIGHAADVQSRLAALEGADAESFGPAGRGYLYRPRIAGRAAELKTAGRVLRGARRGSGGLLLIAGESGVGKTRLANELGRMATQGGMLVRTGSCRAFGTSQLQALLPVLQHAEDLCRERGAAVSERVLKGRSSVLAPYHPPLRNLLGEPRDLPELPPEEAAIRVYVELGKLLAELAAQSPVVILVDDLHLADELSLEALSFLLSRSWFADKRVLFVGTYRPEEAPPELLNLAGQKEVLSIPLPSLESPAVEGMVRDMLALDDGAPEGLLGPLMQGAQGNPMFVTEFLRDAVDRGLLYRDDRGRWQGLESSEPWAALPLPSSVDRLLTDRIDSLTEDALSVVTVMAVLGEPTSLALLSRISGLDDPTFYQAIAELRRRQVLVEDSALVQFAHSRLGEVSYEAMDAERRAVLHRTTAEVLEETTEDRDEISESLARHWDRAEEPERARPYFLAAARRAHARFATDRSIELYRSYLERSPHPNREAVQARIEAVQGPLRARGRLAEVVAEIDRTLEEARQLGDAQLEAEALLLSADAWTGQGRRSEARRSLELARAIFEKLGDRRGEGRAIGILARLSRASGRLDEAVELYREALVLIRRTQDGRGEVVTLANLALVEKDRGRAAEARELSERAIALAQESGERKLEAELQSILAFLSFESGDTETARSGWGRALEQAREVGLRNLEARTLANLGGVANAHQRLSEAVDYFEQALLIHREIGLTEEEARMLTNLASIREQQGQLDASRQLLLAAVGILHGREASSLRAAALAGLGRLERFVTGDLLRARELVEEAISVARQINDPEQLGAALCQRGHCHLAAGAPAEPSLRQAQELSASIPNVVGLRDDVAALSQAAEAFSRGEPLVCGCHPESLPPPFVEWLRRHRPGEF